MTSLYSLRSLPAASEWIITKFDGDYNVESVYAVSATGCSCPQSHKPTCRHRKMLPLFLSLKHVDDGWFLDWDTRLWRKPLASEAIPSQPPTERERVAAFEEENYDCVAAEPPTPAEVEPVAPAPSAPPSVGGSPLRVKRRKI